MEVRGICVLHNYACAEVGILWKGEGVNVANDEGMLVLSKELYLSLSVGVGFAL
jgi:hypothetical protein